MSIHYESTQAMHHYVHRFDLESEPPARVVKPGEQGLFVRRPRGDLAGSQRATRFEAATGRFGLVPLFAPSMEVADTFTAAAESAAGERNFYQPWKRGHRCVVLADAIVRPGAPGAPPVRVSRTDGQPLHLAGLWNGWRSPTGECLESFALFTLPAPDQPNQRRVVFLPDAWVDDWLHCPVEETAAYLRPFALDRLKRTPLDAAALPACALQD